MVYLEIGAPIEMAFLRPLTANKNPHPAPVAPLAEHIVAERGELGLVTRAMPERAAVKQMRTGIRFLA